MFMIVLTSCSISPRIPWVAGNNLTSSVLLYFFESNASLCGVSYKYQPTSARSNMPTYALRHPGVSCGSPLLSPGHRVLLGGTWHGKLFVGQEKYASVPWKSQMKDCSSICQKVFVYFLLKVIGIGCVWVVTGEQTTFKLLFWCFIAGSQHFCSVHGNYWCIWGEKSLYLIF